jgi:hypothetical protein
MLNVEHMKVSVFYYHKLVAEGKLRKITLLLLDLKVFNDECYNVGYV